MDVERIIEAKRDGREHSAAQIDEIVLGYARGDVPDHQMAAWLMAVYLKGLTLQETVFLTDAMVRSGEVLDLSSIPGVKVDKHSTGGVADTTTLVLAPLLAACGVKVAKMSGRGLGFTGGTLDKLESIPGFSVDLDPERFLQQVRDIGVAVIAQSDRVVPADKKIYSLRDVTATVPSIPLIVSSILSKKIAGGADVILIDVKVGSGAFMKTLEDARALSEALVSVGELLGKRVSCVLTDMDLPLGSAIGNALEVAEAIEVLRGKGDDRLAELCLGLATRILVLSGRCPDTDTAAVVVREAIDSGSALETTRRWIAAQGGDARVVDDPSILPQAVVVEEFVSPKAGYLVGCDAEMLGRAASALGAGRTTLGGSIDPAAGIRILRPVGSLVERGESLFELHTSTHGSLPAARELITRSLVFAMEPVTGGAVFL